MHKVNESNLFVPPTALSISANEYRTQKSKLKKNLCYLLYLARFGLYLKGKSLKHTENDFEKVYFY